MTICQAECEFPNQDGPSSPEAIHSARLKVVPPIQVLKQDLMILHGELNNERTCPCYLVL